MTQPHYLNVWRQLHLIDDENRQECRSMYRAHRDLFLKTQGSTNNHQAWLGGYDDHIKEIMNIAKATYELFNSLRPLPFTLSDVLLVLFLHDIEKPWKYCNAESGQMMVRAELVDKEAQHQFRAEIIAKYDIHLTEEHKCALRYAEGEGSDYSSEHRMMNELGALVHICDVASARLWPNHPLIENDPWDGAERSVYNV